MPIDPITGLPTNQSGVTPGSLMDPSTSVPGTNVNQGSPGDAMSPTGQYDYPDYQGLLAKWLAPYQQQYEGDTAAAKAGLDASTATARERYQQGDTSTIARLKGVHDDNLLALRNSLNARGLLGTGVTLRAMGKVPGSGHGAGRFGGGSGEVGYQAGRENLSYKRSRYDAENQLLDYLKGLQQAFADSQRQGLLALNQQRTSLADTISQIYQPTLHQGASAAQGGPGDLQAPSPGGAQAGFDPQTGLPLDWAGTPGVGPGQWVPNGDGTFRWVAG